MVFTSKILYAIISGGALAAAAPTSADGNVSFKPTVNDPSGVTPSTGVTDPASQQVTLASAFTSGAGNTNNANVNDGIGSAGTDTYNCYYGGWESFPAESEWVEFEAMFTFSTNAMLEGCGNLGLSEEDTQDQVNQIYTGIQQVAEASLVDHRFILATIMQESIGCVYVGTTSNGVTNPGIMQSHDGVTYDSSNSQSSITQMIIDGTQGTASGDGLVQLINQYGNIYEAARGYNSGSVSDPSNLNDANGATASYVNDIANRMTGWLYTPSTFSSC